MEAERKAKAYPILKYLETYIQGVHEKYTRGEAMEKALRYAFAVWVRIGRYVQSGHFNIDNNLMEQAIRPVTLGRKNYLFCGNNEGAEKQCYFLHLSWSVVEKQTYSRINWLREILSKPLLDMTEQELYKITTF